jgi:hypothetical protein
MDTIQDSITYDKMERSIELLEFIVKEFFKNFEVDKNTSLKERLIECNKKFLEMDEVQKENEKIKIDEDDEEEEEITDDYINNTLLSSINQSASSSIASSSVASSPVSSYPIASSSITSSSVASSPIASSPIASSSVVPQIEDDEEEEEITDDYINNTLLSSINQSASSSIASSSIASSSVSSYPIASSSVVPQIEDDEEEEEITDDYINNTLLSSINQSASSSIASSSIASSSIASSSVASSPVSSSPIASSSVVPQIEDDEEEEEITDDYINNTLLSSINQFTYNNNGNKPKLRPLSASNNKFPLIPNNNNHPTAPQTPSSSPPTSPPTSPSTAPQTPSSSPPTSPSTAPQTPSPPHSPITAQSVRPASAPTTAQFVRSASAPTTAQFVRPASAPSPPPPPPPPPPPQQSPPPPHPSTQQSPPPQPPPSPPPPPPHPPQQPSPPPQQPPSHTNQSFSDMQTNLSKLLGMKLPYTGDLLPPPPPPPPPLPPQQPSPPPQQPPYPQQPSPPSPTDQSFSDMQTNLSELLGMKLPHTGDLPVASQPLLPNTPRPTHPRPIPTENYIKTLYPVPQPPDKETEIVCEYIKNLLLKIQLFHYLFYIIGENIVIKQNISGGVFGGTIDIDIQKMLNGLRVANTNTNLSDFNTLFKSFVSKLNYVGNLSGFITNLSNIYEILKNLLLKNFSYKLTTEFNIRNIRDVTGINDFFEDLLYELKFLQNSNHSNYLGHLRVLINKFKELISTYNRVVSETQERPPNPQPYSNTFTLLEFFKEMFINETSVNNIFDKLKIKNIFKFEQARYDILLTDNKFVTNSAPLEFKYTSLPSYYHCDGVIDLFNPVDTRKKQLANEDIKNKINNFNTFKDNIKEFFNFILALRQFLSTPIDQPSQFISFANYEFTMEDGMIYTQEYITKLFDVLNKISQGTNLNSTKINHLFKSIYDISKI